MRLDLIVTQASDIKSKQPWPRLAWLGKQVNDLLLVDSRRIKVLCLNGKTTNKKRIGKLQPHTAHLVASNVSSNGEYLICLLESGKLLIYHKDQDLLKTVPGLDQSQQTSNKSTSKPSYKDSLVFISNDAYRVLVVLGRRQLFLWEINRSILLSSAKEHILEGSWSCIDNEGAILPSLECKELSIHVRFFNDDVVGSCCVCSFVFNRRSNIQVSTVFLHWFEPCHIYTVSQPHYTAQWSTLSYPLSGLSESADPVRHHGAYLGCHSNSGHTLAIGVNQRNPADIQVLFVSVLRSVAVSADMKGCSWQGDGLRKEKIRSYWLADMAWTADDLFMACVNKLGCLVILSRLGEPVLLQSSGCSVEHEPGYFLPFHPLITFIPKKRSSSMTSYNERSVSPTSSIRSEVDDKRQRYSIAAHPALPAVFLVSDGYLVTVMKLPGGLTCDGVVRDFLTEGRTAVNLLLDMQGHNRGRRLSSLQESTLSRNQDMIDATTKLDQLSTSNDGLLSTIGSDMGDYAARFEHLDEGHFVYSDPIKINASQQVTDIRDSDRLSTIHSRAYKALLSAWGLAVSHTGEWTRHYADLLQYTAKTLVKLVSVMLESITPGSPSDLVYASILCKVLNLLKSATTLLHWDCQLCKTVAAGVRLIKGTVCVLLRYSRHHRYITLPRCCVSILQYCEKLLTTVYSLTPTHQPMLNHRYGIAEIVQNSVLSKRESVRVQEDMVTINEGSTSTLETNASPSEATKTSTPQEVAGIVPVRHTPAKSLTSTWKILYRHLVRRYKKLLKASSIHYDRGVQRVLVLLCGVQMKLKQLGCTVPLSLCDQWSSSINARYLKGCKYYLQGYPEEAVSCWYAVVYQTNAIQHGALDLLNNRKLLSLDHRSVSSSPHRCSLLAILYTHLQLYNLASALDLVDSLIYCYSINTEKSKRREGVQKPYRLIKMNVTFFRGSTDDKKSPTPLLPCIPDPVRRYTVSTLARFMARYFTNNNLYIYPPCSPLPLPVLHRSPDGDCKVPRSLPLYHDRISASVRYQQLSYVWTADTAMALLLVCGLLTEAIWLARELGDWKSALMLSVMASQSDLILSETLTPLVIIKEAISVILQTPVASSPLSGVTVKRNASFNEQDCHGNNKTLNVSGMRRSSSMCSINEDDQLLQEQLSHSLSDMLTAATVVDLDPTPWLLGNLMDHCFSLVAGFNSLVPEEFYLPAPPFYCPQPDYEPKNTDPMAVLYESSLRHEVNEVIQLVRLVLNSAKCSLPCARWYCQQLELLATQQAGNKKGTTPRPLPRVLRDHTSYPIDLLLTSLDSSRPSDCVANLLTLFRNLCAIVWMLHVRDKLTMAVRKYQASRERTLRVKAQNKTEELRHKELLQEIIIWADNLHPFSSFLNLEEEIEDILLTAISELPPTRKIAALLARHFYASGQDLSPVLQEKFQRLNEKMKRKREMSTRKSKRETNETESKRKVRYESLYEKYRYECKLRSLAISNRKETFGVCELQVFEHLVEGKPAGNQDDVGKTESKTPPRSDENNERSKEERRGIDCREGSSYPRVGSREFESNPQYLDFLETFFLVVFGKIVQDSSPFTKKPNLPRLKVYSKELRQKEISSVVRMMPERTKPLTVELDVTSIKHSTNNGVNVKMGVSSSQTERIRSKSMFHFNYVSVHEDSDIIPLSKHGLNTNADKIKSSSKFNVESSSRRSGILQPYSTITVNPSKVYRSHSELLQWFGRWAERQLSVQVQKSRQEKGDSKAVIRVRLPQQLVLNSLWLNRHIYQAEVHTSRKTSPEWRENVDSQLNPSPEIQLADCKSFQKADRIGFQSVEPKGFQNGQDHNDKLINGSVLNEQTTSKEESIKELTPGHSELAKMETKKKRKKKPVARKDSQDNKPHRKRQLPVITPTPRDLTSSHQKDIDQLTSKTKPAKVSESKPVYHSSSSDESRENGKLKRIVTSQGVIDVSYNSEEEKASKSTTRKSQTKSTTRSQGSQYKKGVFSSDVYYYFDSDDSSGTLEISSLDEAEGTLTKEGSMDPQSDRDANITMATDPHQDEVSQQPWSLHLNMKDADIKRLVREEFRRIMMEKYKSDSQTEDYSNKHSNEKVPESLQCKVDSDKSMQDQQPIASTSKSGNLTHLSGHHHGVDVETQAPSSSLLMKSHTGNGEVKSHPDVNGTMEGDDRILRYGNLGDGCLRDGQDSSHAQLHPEVKLDQRSSQFDFKNGLDSASVASDVPIASCDTTTQDDRGMSPLRLEDLEDKPQDTDVSQPQPLPIHPGSTQEYDNCSQTKDGVTSMAGLDRPPSHQPLFHYDLQTPPVLLTVPQNKLLSKQGTHYPPTPVLTQLGTHYHPSAPLPAQVITQSVGTSHPEPTNSTPFGTSASYSGSGQCGGSVYPHNHQSTIPPQQHPNVGYIPHPTRYNIPPQPQPRAYNYPVQHLISMLHESNALPPIPLLHVNPRYPPNQLPRYPPNQLPRYPAQQPVYPASLPPKPLPLLKLQSGNSQCLVPLEELNAFEKKQRHDRQKHPAREMRDAIDGEGGTVVLGPPPLLHVQLNNDLANSSRWYEQKESSLQPTGASATQLQVAPVEQSQLTNSNLDTVSPQEEICRQEDKSKSGTQDTGPRTKRKIGGRTRKVSTSRKETKMDDKDEDETEDIPSSLSPCDGSEVEIEESELEDDTRRRRQDLRSQGYAIKLGLYGDVGTRADSGRSRMPTTAQIHYDTVRKLQAKSSSTQSASTTVQQTKDVATSMNKDDFPHRASTVTDITSQYTAAATGLATTGKIVAPDIFYNLRFGSSTSKQQVTFNDTEVVTKDSANKGRAFISVVDIDIKDLPTSKPVPEPMHGPSLHSSTQQFVGHTQPSSPPAEAYSDAVPRELSPSNAQLHYKALFKRDAHPKMTSPITTKRQQEQQNEEEVAGGPDEVTLNIFKNQPKASTKTLSISARHSTRDRVQHQLSQMDQQLSAIEESAGAIEQDFRNTSLMLHTVEKLADVMVPVESKIDYSLRGYKEPDQTDQTAGGVHGDVVEPSVEEERLTEDEVTEDEGQLVAKEKEIILTERKDNSGSYEDLSSNSLHQVTPRQEEEEGPSKKKADKTTGDAYHLSSNSLRQPEVTPRQEEEEADKTTGDAYHLSSNSLRQLLAEGTPRQEEEEGWPSGRKPAERSEQERKKLKEWAAKRRSQNLVTYKKQRDELIGSEHKPYHAKSTSGGLSSLQEIKKMDKTRNQKRKTLTQEGYNERVEAAKALMAEIFTDKPLLQPLHDTSYDNKEHEKRRRPMESKRLGKDQDDSAMYEPRLRNVEQNWSKHGRSSGLNYSPPRHQEKGYPGDYEDSWRSNSNHRDPQMDDWGGISDITEKSRHKAEDSQRKPKSYQEIVRVQRPEVTRKNQKSSGRRQKTYGEMLKEMKGERGSERRPSGQSMTAKQRLYGTTKIPGSTKPMEKIGPRVTKTYGQQLSEMQHPSGSQTRLVPRTRHKLDTATIIYPNPAERRHQVERRGIHAEPTPRSSTRDQKRATGLAVPSSTYRTDVVSPTPKVGAKYRPREQPPTTYVERLQRASLEAPRTHRHKVVYVTDVPQANYKSPPLRIPATKRHSPYPRQGQRSQPANEWEDRSGVSDLSLWSVPDDVRNILDRTDSYEGDIDGDVEDALELDYEGYTSSVDIRQLEDIASISSGSILSNIDWGVVDKMIADVR